jgi:hypothetical protein
MMHEAKAPFQFVAASYLIRIRPERAETLAELADHLRSVSDSSVFFHTFQSLEAHHYTTFSNDFAQWAMAACNEAVLAEELGAIDLRDFVSLEEVRQVLAETLEDYIAWNPQSANRPAFEPFYFCEAVAIALPLDARANTLAELAEGIRRMSLQTLHHHFINARLRPKLGANDFSSWIADSLGLPALADALNRVDFYTNTLEGVRAEILQIIGRWNR